MLDERFVHLLLTLEWQMPLSNRLAAACLDRTVTFYDMHTGEYKCRIANLHTAPTCIECLQVLAQSL